MRALGLATVALSATAWLASPAWASTLDLVRTEAALRCGAEPRPGFAAVLRDGSVGGIAVELCRAVAHEVLGPGAKIAFRLYDSSLAFDAVRRAGDELFFLSDEAVADEMLGPAIMRGPTVFVERLELMVAQHAAAQRPQDLAGQAICFMIASDAQRALDAAFHAWGLEFRHLAFEEDIEMLDAYNVQRCAAVAAEATSLSVLRHDSGVNHLASRVLPEPLANYPVFAATGIGDPEWSTLVADVISRDVSIGQGQAGFASRQARE